MEKVLSEILEENKGYSMYWELNYLTDSGWKKKYLFGTIADLEKYTERYMKGKRFEQINYSIKEVEIIQRMYPKVKFQVLK